MEEEKKTTPEEAQARLKAFIEQQTDAEELLKLLPQLSALVGFNLDTNAGLDRNPQTGHHNGVILQGFELLDEEAQAKLTQIQRANEELYKLTLERIGGDLTPKSSGQAFIDCSPVARALIKGDKGEIKLGVNEETGETAIITIIDAMLEPLEKEYLDCISNFKLDGQVTEAGKIWHTVGQLYRASRPKPGKSQSPTKEQRDAIMETLNGLERKLTFKLNDYLKIWGGFETNGGRIPILSFNEYFGKIQGQEDLLIVHSDQSIISMLAERLHMYERPADEVKTIYTKRYNLVFNEPIEINGKPVKKRSFATNEERRKFCLKYGITAAQIASYDETKTPLAMSDQRVRLRSYIFDFIFSYIRARAVGKPYSPLLPYSSIFERCKINTASRETVKRAKADIAIILDSAVDNIEELKAWQEYTNKGSKKADGIQIFLQLPEITGG